MKLFSSTIVLILEEERQQYEGLSYSYSYKFENVHQIPRINVI